MPYDLHHNVDVYTNNNIELITKTLQGICSFSERIQILALG